MKNTITKIKNLLEELNSRFEQAEESTNLKIDQSGLCNLRKTKKKERREMNTASKICETSSSISTGAY